MPLRAFENLRPGKAQGRTEESWRPRPDPGRGRLGFPYSATRHVPDARWPQKNVPFYAPHGTFWDIQNNTLLLRTPRGASKTPFWGTNVPRRGVVWDIWDIFSRNPLLVAIRRYGSKVCRAIRRNFRLFLEPRRSLACICVARLSLSSTHGQTDVD